MNYAITYPGKIPEQDILTFTPAASLSLKETVGPLHGKPSNKLIKGDNLFTLKALYNDPKVRGHVRLIYIDPPYSTQRVFRTKSVWYQDHVELEDDAHAYEDTLSGEEYIEFIRQRLVFLRELLSPDGTIYVHLDDKMAFAIKVIMDELFGPNNFRNWITRRKCSSKNYTSKQFGNITDYLICYSKFRNPVWNQPYRAWDEKHAAREYPRIEKDTGRRYKPVPVYAHGVRNGDTGKPWRGMMPPKGKHWFTSPENLDKLDAEGRIYWSPTGNPRKKVYLDESPGVSYTDLWMNFRDAHNQNVSVTGYPTEKNLDMLKMIIQASSNEGDLILDGFVGSGTTLDAAAALKRHWIGIDSSDLAIQVCRDRLATQLTNTAPDLFNNEHNPSFAVLEAEVEQSNITPREAIAS